MYYHTADTQALSSYQSQMTQNKCPIPIQPSARTQVMIPTDPTHCGSVDCRIHMATSVNKDFIVLSSLPAAISNYFYLSRAARV